MINQHNPKCPPQSECSICFPTNLEKLAQLCSTVEIAPLFGGSGYMIYCYTMHEENEGQASASAETIELAALKVLQQLETSR